ncbi:MAG: methylmalonyl-CoA mutase family protein [Leptospiraceae bacterium]|nr:methylmalonyl-CoA mutase family protein [Leptospiraceae bacterium]
MHTVISPYISKNKIRVVTATSLFDGHDASINIMRRIIQSTGAEVIHLGHNRSVGEIVDCAIQEDAQAIAITSYQGGHIEFFKYMYDLLKQKKAGNIKVFGGGGGTILPQEADELHKYGITRIYSPDDGRSMGLQGMINDLLQKSDFYDDLDLEINNAFPVILSKTLTILENTKEIPENIQSYFHDQNIKTKHPIVIGITGTGGAGKSSITDEIVRRYLSDFESNQVAIISIDPTRKKTGGALLGDRIRMNSIYHPSVFMRSFATRESNQSINKNISEIVGFLKGVGFDLIIVETAGIGQSDTRVTDVADLSLYVMTPEYGASTQLEKIAMLDYADIVVLNKFDRFGAEDAKKAVAKQYQRNHNLFEKGIEDMPIFGTIASHFNDPGINKLYVELLQKLNYPLRDYDLESETSNPKDHTIIPHTKTRYLSEIADEILEFNNHVTSQSKIATEIYQVRGTLEVIQKSNPIDKNVLEQLEQLSLQLEEDLDKESVSILKNWSSKKEKYSKEFFEYEVRGKTIQVPNFTTSLSHTNIPKVILPRYKDYGDIIRWSMQENVPGEFPFTAGVYPFKRTDEDPTRMFAGEGGPERTNRRFHYISKGQTAVRLSTAFDSVTLYGEDPDKRPDIYGKIGNSGVSVASLNDTKKLYSGFDLCNPSTSVSMTINGPAPMLLAFFLNAVIDQQCELYIHNSGTTEDIQNRIKSIYHSKGLEPPIYNGELPPDHNGLGLLLLGVTGDMVLPNDIYQNIKKDALVKVRGTVQADILKEDQAQNTCIFSTEFALKLMGDMQEFMIQNNNKNFYTVSISGYHIAEAGANPITQLALTLSNGFTYVEYYLSRGMSIDDFAPNLSFFFSNGMDPEYSVIGRVARRIWAKAIKYRYKGSVRSQLLKYHIQTSGRSLHAQEIEFNDIRTTLQALNAIYDNCNSLHTNAYDEAITTPTEESVRRAIAIQLIINRELGLAKNENTLQGSFIIEELTDLVEEAVLLEFRRISERGGVLGAMETMYQRSKIQDESMYYEQLKHTGKYSIVGVNTFLSSKGSPTIIPVEVIRSSIEERNDQIQSIQNLTSLYSDITDAKMQDLQNAVKKNENVFYALMEASKYLSLGQLTNTLYKVGGQYRRNM